MSLAHPRMKPLAAGARLGARQRVFRALYPLWTRLAFTTRIKRKRVRLIDQLLGGALARAERVLDVGCANGQDFVRFLADSPARVYGVDVEPYEIAQANFTFVRADAEQLAFPDGHFDVAVSIGVFEHIQPIEKLCRAAAEIRRVSRAYCVIVPSVGTLLEPHAAELFWHLRDHNRKTRRANLNYFSDEAWLKFGAFEGAQLTRFWYVPMLVQCLAIYGFNAGARTDPVRVS